MNRSLILSISLAVIATLWILSGSLSTSATPEDASTSDQKDKSAPLFKVKLEQRTAQKMQDQIVLQGGIEAARKIEVRAETEGTIEKLYVKKGDRLKAGQAILSLAMKDKAVRLERAKAELRVKQAELASSKSLKYKKMISENQHEQNLANVVSAQAEVKEIEIEIEQTKITAAFDGVLNDLHVELGDYVSPGSSIATLVDQDWVTITTQVPQQHIAKIRKGQRVEATLLSGTKLSGKINYISSSADLATRTFLIEARAENAVGIQYFGQSARVRIYLGERSAHLLSPSLLNLNSDGGLQIKTLDENSRVMSHDVTMIRSDNEGIWLSGLPETINLITVGQGFVSDGELVEAVSEPPSVLSSQLPSGQSNKEQNTQQKESE